ncbi:hypothetical protein GGS23DRAFT_593337 [Durotheca rogersii]|uniref:uncharacterized protein n=1 Tax=Durotheca rogersii TaxID=419775 RepID=UPI0022206C13|nr:uncharacterized protein GGS23DRAFT_593337 [Durotheca rogersii]KAI5866595.1 hypothetical protein GGS23DRAFT_593337 [Durotheca rogersii]
MSSLAAQYCRVAHRQLRPRHDGIWTLDALLSAAFQHFCMVSRKIARHGSSVPGPMENRRRLGRRRMGELNFGQPQCAAPPWGLESLADLTQWKWTPPTPSERLRESRAKTSSDSTLTQIVTDWLSGVPPASPADRPSVEARGAPDGDLAPGEVLSSVAPDQAAQAAPVVDTRVTSEVHWRNLLAAAGHRAPKVIWGTGIAQEDVVRMALDGILGDPTAPANLSFADFCESWCDGVSRLLFSGEAICSILDAIQLGIDTELSDSGRCLDPKEADAAKLAMLRATIKGLSGHGFDGRSDLDHIVWCDILHRISDLKINAIGIFTNAMGNIPDSYLGRMPMSITANLHTYIAAAKRTRSRVEIVRQADRIAKPLRQLNSTHHLHILESCTAYVLAYRDEYMSTYEDESVSAHTDENLLAYIRDKEQDYAQMRLAWLLLLARLPGVDSDHLVRVCSQLEAGTGAVPLTNREICELYLVRNRSSLGNMIGLYNAIQDVRGCDNTMRYGWLCLSLWRRGEFAHVKRFCEFLHDLGREQDIMRVAQGLRNVVRSQARPLANLAIGARDPVLAINLYSLSEKGKGGSSHFWRANFSSEALALLMRSRSLRHEKILGVLYIFTRFPRRRGVRGHRDWRRGLTNRQLHKVIRLSVAFAQSRTVTNRTALALITRCVMHLQGTRGPVLPTLVLKALFYNITRDLDEGRPGRTTRLRWYLRLLGQRDGYDEMLRISERLDRWRASNARRLLFQQQ